jgi:hypothetical protein
MALSLFALTGLLSTRAEAAEYKYRIYSNTLYADNFNNDSKKYDKSSKTEVLEYSYRLPIIDGDSKAVNTVNDFLFDLRDKFMDDKDKLAKAANDVYKDSKLSDAYDINGKWFVKYINDDYVSLKYVYKDKIGSDVDYRVDTYTFSLKSGKRLYADDFLSGSRTSIINSVIDAYRDVKNKKYKKYSFYDDNELFLKESRISDLPFYYNGNGITLDYSPKTLAPYAAGEIIFNIK